MRAAYHCTIGSQTTGVRLHSKPATSSPRQNQLGSARVGLTAFLAELPRKEARIAKRLKVATVRSTLTLHHRGWLQQCFAAESGVDRETAPR